MVKSNTKKALAITALAIITATSIIACGKKNANTEASGTQATTISAEHESTTATDIMAVTITDKNGNKHVVEGVGVTDESGKTTITVTDEKGNETVIVGEVETDAAGGKTVSNATVVAGSEITTSDGTVIDTTEATVEDVKDNNSGDIKTDVAVSEDKKQEVESKKEEASKEAATQAQTEKATTSVAEKETEKPTEAQTQAPAEKPTEAATTKPTQPQTEAATVKPTEAVTQAPTVKPLSKEEEFIANCQYKVRGNYIQISNYTGAESEITIPAYIDGLPVKYVIVKSNPNLKKISMSDDLNIGDDGLLKINNCNNLEIVNFGTGITNIKSNTISYCANIKEINMYGKVTHIAKSWADAYPLNEYFKGAVLNIHNNPKNVLLGESSIASNWLDDILNKFNSKNGLADDDTEMFKEVNFIY